MSEKISAEKLAAAFVELEAAQEELRKVLASCGLETRCETRRLNPGSCKGCSRLHDDLYVSCYDTRRAISFAKGDCHGQASWVPKRTEGL